MNTLIVYAHLLAACVSIGVLLMQDLALWRSRNRPLTIPEIGTLRNTATVVFIALLALWITGIALVTVGAWANPEQYLWNQKLWAKFSVVVVLTLNGFFLHFYSFPKITGNKGVLQLPLNEQRWIGCSGALSTVSWLFACYLGIARPWNYTIDYSSIMFLYGGLICAAFIFAYEVMKMSRNYETTDLSMSSKIDRDTV